MVASPTLEKPSTKTASTGSSLFQIGDREFDTLRDLIYQQVGIVLKPQKRYLLVNRLAKRLRHLGLGNFKEYLVFLERSPHRKQELIELIDAVTTNKTDFYREDKHFRFMEEVALPEFSNKAPSSASFHVWSSACSSGEEPYTTAICLSEYFSKHTKRPFNILGTDVCETVLRQAAAGIYEPEKVKPIPRALLNKYFIPRDGAFQVKPELRRTVTLKKLNLLHNFHLSLRDFDVVFIRNVMIYFDKKTQEEIINKQWHTLKPGGYLFLGHSETLQGLTTQFRYVSPSIYQK